MKKVMLLLLGITTLIYGCDKHEHTYKKIYGIFTVYKYTVDGVDSLALFKDSLSTTFEFLNNEGQSPFYLQIYGTTNQGKGVFIQSNWHLELDNKTLVFHEFVGNNYGTGPFTVQKQPTFEIIKLKKEELIMKSQFNNKVYEIGMKQ